MLPTIIIMIAGCRRSTGRPAGAPTPPEVLVTTVLQQDVPVTGEWVATLDGYVNAQIQPQVSGYLVRQNYREGSFVHEGEVLFEIDPRPFEATLAQAKGQLAQARGQLSQAKAQLDLARINVKRDTPLAKARAIAQSQLDTEIQAEKTAEANIETARAAIQTAEAAIQTAELNLGFTKVRALVDGIAGIAAVQIGNLVGPSTVLTTVSKVDPIKVYFPISEQEYLHVTGLAKSGSGDAWLRKAGAVSLQLVLADGTLYRHSGRIVFTDRQVDAQTGTIRVVGAFSNPGNILRPGQFGRIRAIKETRRGALLVPQRAVGHVQGQYQVAVVGDDNKVNIRQVTLGPRADTLWVIDKGLNPGERVITEGITKVSQGMTVVPKAN
jgi:membrane fusion protein (multidrug efflux system)